MADRFTPEEIMQQLTQLGYTNVTTQSVETLQEDVNRLTDVCVQHKQKEIRNSENSPISKTDYKELSMPRFAWQRTIPVQIEKLPLPEPKRMADNSLHPSLSSPVDPLSTVTPEASSYFGFGSVSCRSSTQRIRKILRRNSNGERQITSELIIPDEPDLTSEPDECQYDGSEFSDTRSSSGPSKNSRPQSTQRYRYHRNPLLEANNDTSHNSFPKTDRVALYHYYKNNWDRFTIPDRGDRKQLRREVRAKMSKKS